MATYVMSDLHGRLSQFNKMLELIQFNAKTDKLYLLGDYVDWGIESIELLQHLIDMTQNENIICLMGNHDKMMLDVVGTQAKDADKLSDKEAYFLYEKIELWAINGGDKTLDSFNQQSEEEREQIINWLKGLKYYIKGLRINGKNYYLCHSKPFLKGMKLEDVVWDRIRPDRLPRGFLDNYPDTTLISGHTIVSNYHSFDKDGKCRIFKPKYVPYINIDCGAKGIGIYKEFRLGCLRLDDLAEFYVE